MRMKRFLPIICVLLAVTLVMTGFSVAQDPDPPYSLSPEVVDVYDKLQSSSDINQSLEFIESDHENTIADQIEITEIPAPPFMEEERAEYYAGRFKELGLEHVHIDEEGNAIGIRPGNGDGPKLVVSAHLDTVFPEGTDTTVTEKDGILYAPGIADDGRGLAALLSVIRALNEADIQTVGDIMFVGTVGEEGEGDLRGVKFLFEEHNDIDGFISVESGDPSNITYLATGSHRYNVTYEGPGGHSFGAFGTPSATHALGRAIANIADLETPDDPKTTFNVGTVSGGTSVNAIAAEASMKVDMRSNDEEELQKLEKAFLTIVEEAAVEENNRWGEEDAITVNAELIGDRPAGSQPSDGFNVQAAWASVEAIGLQPSLGGPSSTDSNWPISLGIPSLTLRGGGQSGGTHSLDEWFDPTDAYLGPQQVLLTSLGLVGVDGLTEPLLGRDGQSDPEKPVIENLQPTEDVTLDAGETVKIEFDSKTGLKATFAIRIPLTNTIASATELPMMETEEGHYVGYWTATSNIQVEGAEIEVKVSDDKGNETRKTAKGKLNINTNGK